MSICSKFPSTGSTHAHEGRLKSEQFAQATGLNDCYRFLPLLISFTMRWTMAFSRRAAAPGSTGITVT